MEQVTHFLGHSYLSLESRTSLSAFRPSILADMIIQRPKAREIFPRYSQCQSRYLTLVLASILHACFFAIMGSKKGFPSMLIAYVISAFARSFVSGELSLFDLFLTEPFHTIMIYSCVVSEFLRVPDEIIDASL